MSDQILTYIKETVDRIEDNQKDHVKRITEVEKWQANANGKISIIAAICTAIGGGAIAAIDYFRR